uniref:Uncharacterized protein n=1 Tax=Anguilla anguilla TaxID=7936 RepID=A0A0E9PXT5_ANGAN
MGRLGKTLPTLNTFVGLFTCMNSQVVI